MKSFYSLCIFTTSKVAPDCPPPPPPLSIDVLILPHGRQPPANKAGVYFQFCLLLGFLAMSAIDFIVLDSLAKKSKFLAETFVSDHNTIGPAQQDGWIPGWRSHGGRGRARPSIQPSYSSRTIKIRTKAVATHRD